MNKKKICALLGAAALIMSLAGCECKHKNIKEADCENSAVCQDCEKKLDTPALGHKWSDATCEVPKTCSLCGKTEGEPSEHKWENGTCLKPAKCSVCGKENDKTLAEAYKSTYYNYVADVLCPEKGLASLQPFTMVHEMYGKPAYIPDSAFGIVAVDIDDYDNDENFEMLVISYNNTDFYSWNISLYDIDIDKVVAVDEYNIDIDKPYAFFKNYNFMQINKVNNHLVIHYDCCPYEGSEWNFIAVDLSNGKIEEKMNIAEYFYDDPIKESQINNYTQPVDDKLAEMDISVTGTLTDGIYYNIDISDSTTLVDYSTPSNSNITPMENTNLRDIISYDMNSGKYSANP